MSPEPRPADAGDLASMVTVTGTISSLGGPAAAQE